MQACKWQVAKHEGLRALTPFPILSAVCLAQGVEHCRLSPGFLGPDRSLLHAGPGTAHFPGLFLAEASALGSSLATPHPATHARWSWTCISCVCVCVCVWRGSATLQIYRKKFPKCLGSVLPLACGLGHLSPVQEHQQNPSQTLLPYAK